MYRLGNQITMWRERSAVRRPDHAYPPSPVPAATYNQFKETGLSPFFFDKEQAAVLRHQIQEQYPAGVRATLAAAEQLLDGRITLFGRLLELDHPIHWAKDPLTGNAWPSDFWAAVDVRDGETIGGVKWVRELNRHHHFITLGKAYWLSGDERFARALCGHFASWIEQNPPFVGVNWSSALGNAIRVINWIWALNFIHDSPALAEPLFGRIISALAVQTAFIGRHLSKFSSANNHLIGEAAGLAFVGLHLPWLREAARWRESGMEILTAEIAKQIHPDGVPAEQATGYLAFDLDFYLLVWQSAVLKNLPVPAVWGERIGAACDFISQVMDAAGRVPAIGDSDDGRVVELDQRPEANRFRSILAGAAVLLERPDYKDRAGEWDEKSHWLLGEAGRERFEGLAGRPSPPVSKAFKAGGCCLLRHGDRAALFDCGPLGYLSLAAHGHADALSLLLTIGADPVLIDPGTFAYREGGEWRRFFRGTAAHNTVVVDGLDQSEMRGDFLWGRRADCRLLEWHTGADVDRAAAEHDGYAPLGVIHRRAVAFHKPDKIVVEDWLLGQGAHHLAQNWHFPAEAQVEERDGRFHVRLNGTAVQIATDNSAGLAAAIVKGESSPIQGWVSERYGHKNPAPVLVVSGRCSLPVCLTTVIVWENGTIS